MVFRELFLLLAFLLLVPIKPVRANVTETLNLMVGGAAVAGVSYVAGRAAYSVYEWYAHARFSTELKINDTAPAKELWATLKKEILTNHFKYHARDKFRNYPLLAFDQDLKWYIERLSYTRFFYKGTVHYARILKFIHKLKELRGLVQKDYDLTKERRLFEQNAVSA